MNTKSNLIKKEERKKLINLVDDQVPVKKKTKRTTFRLSQDAHDAIKKIGDLIKVKNSVILGKFVSIFTSIKEIDFDLNFKAEPINEETIRKTYVIEKDTLSNITKTSKELGITRDLFVDKMAVFMYELLTHTRRIKYLNINEKYIKPFWEEAEKIEEKLKKELGKDDPAVKAFGRVIVNIMNYSSFLEDPEDENIPI